MKIRVYYTIWDGGDGSASARLHKSQKEADEYIASREKDGEFDLSEGGYFRDIDTDEYEVVP